MFRVTPPPPYHPKYIAKFHVPCYPKRIQRTRSGRLMKTQEVFSYSLCRNILRKESTFRDFIFHIPNVYKERPINENSRTLIQHFQVFHVYRTPNTCFAVRVISQKSCDLQASIP